jgi:predicted PolB exonuclease-like 3'-5' exonuclease
MSKPSYLVFDAESIPDGVLLSRVKYPDLELSPEEATRRAQDEARAASHTGSDFLPVSFHIPVAVCVARVGADFQLQAVRCLDAPHFRTAEIVKDFWKGLAMYQAKLVTFNGRSFDLPLLELAAFRYGIAAPFHFHGGTKGPRNRYNDGHHLDLMEFLTNYGASRLAGGLDLLSKLLGKPGKVEATGSQVYPLYCQGRLQTINEYCSFDVLDTYFVFLRTRVLTGELTLEREQAVVRDAKAWLARQVADQPHLQRYLDNWGDWQPWP